MPSNGIAFGWCFWRVAGWGMCRNANANSSPQRWAVIPGSSWINGWAAIAWKGLAGLYLGKAARCAVCKLSVSQQQELVTWLERGPTPEENLAAYNGPILRREDPAALWPVVRGLNGLYDLLHRLGYNDLDAADHASGHGSRGAGVPLKKEFPQSHRSDPASFHPGQRFLTFYQDEARLGPARTARSRGCGPKSARGSAGHPPDPVRLPVCLGRGFCPETGAASGLIAPEINTAMMNAFLEEFGNELPADVHAVMVLDRAGWHVAKALKVPANVTLLHPCRPNRRNSIPRKICGTTCSQLLVQPALQDLGRSQRRGH